MVGRKLTTFREPCKARNQRKNYLHLQVSITLLNWRGGNAVTVCYLTDTLPLSDKYCSLIIVNDTSRLVGADIHTMKHSTRLSCARLSLAMRCLAIARIFEPLFKIAPTLPIHVGLQVNMYLCAHGVALWKQLR